jgi:hypothetical protein
MIATISLLLSDQLDHYFESYCIFTFEGTDTFIAFGKFISRYKITLIYVSLNYSLFSMLNVLTVIYS